MTPLEKLFCGDEVYAKLCSEIAFKNDHNNYTLLLINPPIHTLDNMRCHG